MSRSLHPAPFALSLLLALDAFAMRPPEGTHLGMEPARMLVTTQQGQSYASSHPAWQAFLEGEGKGWTARFDEGTFTPHRMRGPGIDMGPLSSEADAGAAVLAFVERHPDLMGVEGAEVRLKSSRFHEDSDAYYVDVDVLRDGAPIWRGGLTFRIKLGNLTMAGVDSYPNIPIINRAVLGEASAVEVARAQGAAPGAEHTDVETERWLLPVEDAGKVQLRHVWVVKSRTETPLGHWEAFVDAETGELVSVHNNIAFLTGQALVEHDVRLGNGATEVSPLVHATIGHSGQQVTSDADGNFTIANGSNLWAALDGTYLRIHDYMDDESAYLSGSYTLAAGSFWSLSTATTWTYIHQAQAWSRDRAPAVSLGHTKINAYVNRSGACNAYWDGSVNFLRAGSGCSNTGRLADVIMHEWGHGFHQSSILSGYYDRSLGEGAADVFAMLQTRDHNIAPFWSSSGGNLRNIDNNNRYPDNYYNSDSYIHYNGLIYGGSMWDTRTALIRTYGEDDGHRILGDIHIGVVRGGTGVADSFDEAVFADDDDGNLGNGTPHLCQLLEGFGHHGLGDGAGFTQSIEHTPVQWTRPNRPVSIEAGLAGDLGCIGEAAPNAGTVSWRVNGGGWQQMDLAVSGSTLEAQLPGFELGDIVEYYLRLEDATGGVTYSPDGAHINPHHMFVGRAIRVACSDFDVDDAGYTHELVSGTAEQGADDWLLGTPLGQSGDPAAAASGNRVWANDLGESGWNGAYQNNKHNRLNSAVYRLGHFTDVILRYQRWLTVEDGYYDQASIRSNGNLLWSNHATDASRGQEHHIDTSWRQHLVPLNNVQGEDVQLSWELETDQGLVFGGWNIDDVCLYAPATTDNRMGITDFTATPGANGVTLQWTNPAFGPIQRVQVRRVGNGIPSSVSDGVLVYEVPRPRARRGMAVVDLPPSGPDVGYAIYAHDGQDWLSWTVDGWNAASIGSWTAVPGTPRQSRSSALSGGGPEASGGCDSRGGAPVSLLFASFVLIGLRRRTRVER